MGGPAKLGTSVTGSPISHAQEESLHLGNRLDFMEAEVVRTKHELEELHRYCQEVFGRVSRFHRRLTSHAPVRAPPLPQGFWATQSRYLTPLF